ncbi:hypothetical protein D3C75_854860 [compost metagenome]
MASVLSHSIAAARGIFFEPETLIILRPVQRASNVEGVQTSTGGGLSTISCGPKLKRNEKFARRSGQRRNHNATMRSSNPSIPIFTVGPTPRVTNDSAVAVKSIASVGGSADLWISNVVRVPGVSGVTIRFSKSDFRLSVVTISSRGAISA